MRQRDSQSSRFIIDSYGWIEYFSDGRLADKYSKYIEESTPGNYLTPTIIIYEVYKKLRAAYSEENAIKAIAHIENCTTVIEIDLKLALKGAESSLGESLSMADALIRGTADNFGAKIITSDPHFKDKVDVIFID